MRYIGLFFLVMSQYTIVVLTAVPSILLKNAASPGLKIPAIGLGTAGYGNDPSVGYGGYPECWKEYDLAQKKTIGCGKFTTRAIGDWISIGGRRIDGANNYGNQKAIGKAIKASSVPRSELFISSKICMACPFGFKEALECFNTVITDLQLDYVDTLLIHYPGPFNTSSKDPYCDPASSLYNITMCRLETWRAVLQIFESGRAKSVGVSNYEKEHIEEIIAAGMKLPSINQHHFHPYGGSAQMALVDFCQANDILFQSYSPLGVPDWHKFPGPHMSTTPLKDPVVVSIAAAHKKTPAQVILAWQWSLGIPFNPRSQNKKHMVENMEVFDIVITPEESNKLMKLHQDTCLEDPDFYECAPIYCYYFWGGKNCTLPTL